MSSRSSSSSPEPVVAKPPKSKKRTKDADGGKPKKKAKLSADSQNQDENSRWAYEPPEGSVLLNHTVDVGEFDWDAVRDDEDLELWIVRVPEGVKDKHLETASLSSLPGEPSTTARVGSIDRKYVSYDVWSIGQAEQTEDGLVGGEEIQGLECLLPRRKKGGKLYVAPKPISRHIIISEKPSLPQPTSAPSSQHPNQNPPRPRYPKDRLKHRFLPYGSTEANQASGAGAGDGDVEMADVEEVSASKKGKGKEKAEEKKGKKRKAEEGVGKKAKKG